VRFFLALLVLVVTLSISGISSAIAAVAVDECCEDGGRDEARGVCDDCPPFCHACACAPSFAVPANHVPSLVRTVERAAPSEPSLQLPPSPSLPGVFHPPRRVA
jgi:hypothetical protein